MNSLPDISIIVVNHRAEPVLRDCLQALSSSTTAFSREVIIVDNPPSIDPILPEDYPDLNIRRMVVVKRCGFGKAANLGATEAVGRHLLFLNPDVIVEPGAVDALMNALAGRGEKVIAVGRLAFPDGRFQISCRRFPTIKNLLFSRQSVLARYFGLSNHAYDCPDFNEVTGVDWAAAAMMLISREVFRSLDGFDESFFMYLEDTDLCYRFGQNGGQVIFVPFARAVHLWGYSTSPYRFRRIVWHHQSVWRYFRKHCRSSVRLSLLAGLLAANGSLSLLLELVRLRPWNGSIAR